jgi:hypothetical protein
MIRQPPRKSIHTFSLCCSPTRLQRFLSMGCVLFDACVCGDSRH